MTQWTDDHFIGGEPALDFANTVYRRTPELGEDLLDDASLATWLQHAGLGDGAPLAGARELRHHFWAIFDAQSAGQDLPSEALAGVLRTASHSGATVTATGEVAGNTAPLTVLALNALRLVLAPQRIRSCDRCGWLFKDTSRAHRRRWCSMKTCGNQAKVARHRAGRSSA